MDHDLIDRARTDTPSVETPSIGAPRAVAPNPSHEVRSRHVTTRDGTRLHLLEAGRGRPVLLVPGWSQTADQFRGTIDALAARCHVFAIDQRGHGESEKPEHGYRIARLAADLHDVLVALDLDGVAAVGHGMGCSVLWAYVDLFGTGRIERFAFCDPAASMTVPGGTDPVDAERWGATLSEDLVAETAAAIAGPAGDAAMRTLVTGWVGESVSGGALHDIVERSLKLPRRHAAALLRDHCRQDWRDVIPRLDVPCLFVGGRASATPWQAVAWCASQVRGARLEILDDLDDGPQLAFAADSSRIDRVLASFVG